jgi:hypothetical protein
LVDPRPDDPLVMPPSEARRSCCTASLILRNPTHAKKPGGGGPDSLGLGKRYLRLSVTQYTSALEVSGFRNIRGAIQVHAGRVHACIRVVEFLV